MVRSSVLMCDSHADIQAPLEAFQDLLRATEWSRRQAYRHLASVGLTASQFTALQALRQHGPLSQGELAREIGKSNGDLTTVVDNLERRALVRRERSQADRRVVQVVLSAEGASLVAQSLPQHSAALEQVFHGLQRRELNELQRICRKICGANGSEQQPAGARSIAQEAPARADR